VHIYVRDPATRANRDGGVFTGVIEVTTPYAVEIDLRTI